MASEMITPNRDDDFGEEIAQVFLKLVNDEVELNKLWRTQPRQLSTYYVNDFMPKFLTLYRLTCDYIEKKKPNDNKVIAQLKDTLYYIDGITGNNCHTININKESINQGKTKEGIRSLDMYWYSFILGLLTMWVLVKFGHLPI